MVGIKGQSCDLNLSPSDFKAYSLPIASIYYTEYWERLFYMVLIIHDSYSYESYNQPEER